MNVSFKGKTYSLTKNAYLAAGGEGSVYVKDDLAFKVYHDNSRVLPEGKIHELTPLTKLNNVLGPLGVITDGGNKNIGFAMKYVRDTEFLCKFFTKSFRDRNTITPEDIKELVKNMQDTIQLIHNEGILIVDLNEMNFLVNQSYDTVYFIDVDSYQTRTYPATALMESVRDRQVKNKKFTTLSDWYSFAVVAFQLYMGCHPYKGRNPNYAAKDWTQMMDDNVSVFHKDSVLPPATQDWSVIPKGHLKWFERIFKGERLAPPSPDAIITVVAKPVVQVVSGNAQFNVQLLYSLDNIIAARFIEGILYTLTNKGLYANGRHVYSFTCAAKMFYDVVPVNNDLPGIVEYSKLTRRLVLYTKGATMNYEVDGFLIDKNLYLLVGDSLIETTLTNFGVKVVAAQKVFSSIFTAHTVFDGFIWQDMLGTCRISAPSLGAGSVHVKELDKTRLVAGRMKQNFLVAFSEKAGQYRRHIVKFTGLNYEILTEDKPLEDINFIVKDNGVCILASDNKLTAFHSFATMKEFNSPLNDESLISLGNDVYTYGAKNVYKINSK